jgi:general secretion pathway protein K
MPRLRRASRRGSALVFALWVALLIGIVGTISMRLAAQGAGAARIEADLARARAAAEGGIWLAAHRLATQEPGSRLSAAGFDLRLAGSEVSVQALDEDGRIDLNAVPEPLLAAMFRTVGVVEPDATILAGRVVEWRAPAMGSSRLPVLASSTDRRADARFRASSQLAAVPGISMALAEALRAGVTVHTGGSWPAQASAPPLVQAVLNNFTANQTPAPARDGSSRSIPSARANLGRRVIWRIRAQARYGATQASVSAVMNLTPTEGMPGRVLEWRHD